MSTSTRQDPPSERGRQRTRQASASSSGAYGDPTSSSRPHVPGRIPSDPSIIQLSPPHESPRGSPEYPTVYLQRKPSLPALPTPAVPVPPTPDSPSSPSSPVDEQPIPYEAPYHTHDPWSRRRPESPPLQFGSQHGTSTVTTAPVQAPQPVPVIAQPPWMQSSIPGRVVTEPSSQYTTYNPVSQPIHIPPAYGSSHQSQSNPYYPAVNPPTTIFVPPAPAPPSYYPPPAVIVHQPALGGKEGTNQIQFFGNSPTSEVTHFLLYTLPKETYMYILLRLPQFYFSRVRRIFDDADLTKHDILRIYHITAQQWQKKNKKRRVNIFRLPDPNWDGDTVNGSDIPITPSMRAFKDSWERFIESLLREWSTLNIISALLVSAILTLLSLSGSVDDPLTRTSAIISLICSLMSILYSCLYIICFGPMRQMHKAASWAEEARRTGTSILWSVWTLLAMPAVWIVWSIIAFVVAVMSYVWRTNAASSPTERTTSDGAALGLRIAVTCVLGIGVLYLVAMLSTLSRYGHTMDLQWKKNLAVLANKDWQSRHPQSPLQAPFYYSQPPFMPNAPASSAPFTVPSQVAYPSQQEPVIVQAPPTVAPQPIIIQQASSDRSYRRSRRHRRRHRSLSPSSSSPESYARPSRHAYRSRSRSPTYRSRSRSRPFNYQSSSASGAQVRRGSYYGDYSSGNLRRREREDRQRDRDESTYMPNYEDDERFSRRKTPSPSPSRHRRNSSPERAVRFMPSTFLQYPPRQDLSVIAERTESTPSGMPSTPTRSRRSLSRHDVTPGSSTSWVPFYAVQVVSLDTWNEGSPPPMPSVLSGRGIEQEKWDAFLEDLIKAWQKRWFNGVAYTSSGEATIDVLEHWMAFFSRYHAAVNLAEWSSSWDGTHYGIFVFDSAYDVHDAFSKYCLMGHTIDVTRRLVVLAGKPPWNEEYRQQWTVLEGTPVRADEAPENSSAWWNSSSTTPPPVAPVHHADESDF